MMRLQSLLCIAIGAILFMASFGCSTSRPKMVASDYLQSLPAPPVAEPESATIRLQGIRSVDDSGRAAVDVVMVGPSEFVKEFGLKLGVILQSDPSRWLKVTDSAGQPVAFANVEPAWVIKHRRDRVKVHVNEMYPVDIYSIPIEPSGSTMVLFVVPIQLLDSSIPDGSEVSLAFAAKSLLLRGAEERASKMNQRIDFDMQPYVSTIRPLKVEPNKRQYASSGSTWP